MAKVFIALKRFGGGRRLQAKYGSGSGRLVQMGTKIKEEDFKGAQHLQSLLDLGLVEEFDSKKKYRTVGDRVKNIKAAVKNDKADTPDDDKKGKKDKG